MIDLITSIAVTVLNRGTTVNVALCPFDDEHTAETAFHAWKATNDKGFTSWKSRD